MLVFAAAGLVIFLFSSRMVGIFDEGILLTDVLRTMAGQVLHRDFCYNYGPAQLYLFTGWFKLFGAAVFVERLAAVFSCSWLTVMLARKFCGRAIPLGAALVCILWSLGLGLSQSLANAALSC